MNIGVPVVTIHDDTARLFYEVTLTPDIPHLWFEVSKEYAGFLSDRCDAALLALLIPCMQRQEEIYVEGAVSEKLYHSLTTILQPALIAIMPSLSQIAIHATILSPSAQSAQGVASGFSGGIDSFCTLADYYYSQPLRSFRLTHLLYHNVGSHGPRGRDLFLRRLSHVQTQSQMLGLPLISVDSNIDDFFSKTSALGFAQTHTIRNASAACTLQNGIGKFLYSSAYPISETFIGKTKAIAYADPVILPLLSSDAFQAVPVGAQYTRVQKTEKTAALPLSYGMLDVCTKPKNGEQCSACKKCLRTLLTLEVLGVLSHYAQRFNLMTYHRKRKLYIAKILGAKDPFGKEIKALIKEKKFSVPWLSRLLSIFFMH